MNTFSQCSKTLPVIVSLIFHCTMQSFCQDDQGIEHHVADAMRRSPALNTDEPSQVLPASRKPEDPGQRLIAMPLYAQGSLTGSFTQGNVFIQDSLNIGLESGAAGYRLAVDGKIMCEELKVQSSASWPDYVFGKNYPLMSLHELEKHIMQYQHLPGIPSATEIKNEGVMVGEMQRLMMEKIEELTLYILEQDRRIHELEETMERKNGCYGLRKGRKGNK